MTRIEFSSHKVTNITRKDAPIIVTPIEIMVWVPSRQVPTIPHYDPFKQKKNLLILFLYTAPFYYQKLQKKTPRFNANSRTNRSKIKAGWVYFRCFFSLFVKHGFRTGPDREVGPWKPGTGMKTGFLSLKNRFFVNSVNR